MKYNQPYGVTDVNASYVNGNPTTGTRGSIPPAESIEFPQREIVNLITDAGLLTPDNTDLHQLSKSIQSTLLWADDDAGTANQYQVTMTPAPTGYRKYLTVVTQINTTNTGASTLNVNALGGKPIVHVDGSQLSANELKQHAIVCFIYDGTNFQLVWTSVVGGGGGDGGGGPIFLSHITNLYVDWGIGDDTNYDGSAATFAAGTNHGPFKTIQRACNEVNKWNLNGFNVNIYVADSLSYPNFVMARPGGSGTVFYQGNTSQPGNVRVTGINHSAIIGFQVGSAQITGFSPTAGGDWTIYQDPLAGIAIGGGGSEVGIQQIYSLDCQSGMFEISRGADGYFTGSFWAAGNASGNASGPGAWLKIYFGATWEVNSALLPNLTITTSLGIQHFMDVTNLAVSAVIFNSIANPAFVAGNKFNCQTNAIMNVWGRGTAYYPGSVAGVQGSGGQYV